ncbi:uncharacterized protein [Drosophila takahashii]|uniref:uncharacterized protein n=1 Tax=Drosophila takahashii TaxID=29030 RepID=UPI0038994C7C
MSAEKNKCLSLTQEFKLMRSEYELRVNQLERDVFECCRILNKAHRTEDLTNSCSSAKENSEKQKFISWKFDMRDFSVRNIAIQIKDNHVYLRAYKKNVDIKQEIYMPQNVDKSKVTAVLTTSGVLTLSVPIRMPLSDIQKLTL